MRMLRITSLLTESDVDGYRVVTLCGLVGIYLQIHMALQLRRYGDNLERRMLDTILYVVENSDIP
jgi:hypothetical protein